MLYENIHKLMCAWVNPDQEQGIDKRFLTAYQTNAIIGIIIEWYSQDFNQPASYMNDQIVAILNYKHL